MADIDRILDSLDPKSGRSTLGVNFKSSPVLWVLCGLLVVVAAGASLALNIASHAPEAEASKADAGSASILWGTLLHEAPACVLYDGREAFKTADGRSLALFAAARYDCPDLARALLAKGVDLEERHFVNGEVLTIEDYAAQFGAIEVIRAILDERKKVDAENQLMLDKKKQEKDQELLQATQREQQLHAILAEDAELRKSIFYDRARLECEVLKEKLGFSARNFRMNDCIRQEVERRRVAREELGHRVPG